MDLWLYDYRRSCLGGGTAYVATRAMETTAHHGRLGISTKQAMIVSRRSDKFCEKKRNVLDSCQSGVVQM